MLKIKSKRLTLVLNDLAQPPSLISPLRLSLQPMSHPFLLFSIPPASPHPVPSAWNAPSLTLGRMALRSQHKCHLLREVLPDYLIPKYSLQWVYIIEWHPVDFVSSSPWNFLSVCSCVYHQLLNHKLHKEQIPCNIYSPVNLLAHSRCSVNGPCMNKSSPVGMDPSMTPAQWRQREDSYLGILRLPCGTHRTTVLSRTQQFEHPQKLHPALGWPLMVSRGVCWTTPSPRLPEALKARDSAGF